MSLSCLYLFLKKKYCFSRTKYYWTFAVAVPRAVATTTTRLSPLAGLLAHLLTIHEVLGKSLARLAGVIPSTVVTGEQLSSCFRSSKPELRPGGGDDRIDAHPKKKCVISNWIERNCSVLCLYNCVIFLIFYLFL